MLMVLDAIKKKKLYFFRAYAFLSALDFYDFLVLRYGSGPSL